ncbi:MAG: aminotransferase class V-fold PLP-dependent enzyme [Ardenticatenia bacterium]|nr:aminotransferase class V-fold PLP-dependent enzyme [Ardenticatenia bacterium]
MHPKEGPSTRSVHLTSRVDPATRAIVPPIVQNSAYGYQDLETWRAVALNQAEGHIYSRNSNPTTDLFEEKVAALEGAESGTSFATGMAAISSTLFALLSPGQRVVSVRDAYGATFLHFTQILPRFGVICDVCETEDHEAIEVSIARGCDLLYLETPTNPTLKVLDLARLIAAAQKVGAVTVVDNTFATPINQNPIALGADLVIHSATKYLGGHGDVLGGVLCGRQDLVEEVYRFRELTGPSMQAHTASLLLRSLKTLGLRVQRQNENAEALARFLEGHPKVERVFYPGLESNRGHEIARRQMRGYGGVLSFAVTGGLDAIARFLPRLRYAYMAANLGQVETIVGPPLVTSHVECTEEERAAAGIPEGLVRYAVGIEDLEDLKSDLEQALTFL